MKWRGENSAKLGGNGEEERAGRVDSIQNMKQVFERRLVKYESVPEYLKENKFILDYYRCKWPLKETLFSVFAWHNETLNIWTCVIRCWHLGGFIIFVALTVLSSLEKNNNESLIIHQTYASNTMDDDDDGQRRQTPRAQILFSRDDLMESQI
ncbi:unnamed protein product [Camellia sinensis]